MGETSAGIPALVWLEPGQEELAREMARCAGLRIVAAGVHDGFRRSAEAPALDGAEAFSDLRLALATAAIEVVLLATAPTDAESQGPDADLLRLVRSRNLKVLTLEPIPASVSDARAAEPAQWRESVRFVGLFREAPQLAMVDELLATFGTPRTLSVAFRCGRGQGSLGARLFDAMQAVQSLLGTPESIDASIITRVASSGLRLESGESLRALHGDLTANLRFAGAKSAALSLSDRAGRWFRGVTLVGESGCIRMDESGVERIGEDGSTLDESTSKGKKKKPRGEPTEASPLAEAARRAIDPHAPAPAAFDLETVLAMCEAAMLSARTGQPESPGTVLRMA